MKIEEKIQEVKTILATYRKVEASSELKEYNTLKPVIESMDFRAARHAALNTEYEQTDEYAQLKGIKKLLRGYIAWKWNRGRAARWAASELGKQDLRFAALENNADIQLYLTQDPKQIAEWESYKTLLDDNMQTKTNWEDGYYFTAKNAKKVYSFVNEQAAIVAGKNIETSKNGLSLVVKKENAKATAWDEKKGFVMMDFDYTGAAIHSTQTFTEGIVIAKVRFTGDANEVLYLTAGEKTQPIVIAKNNGDNDWQEVSYTIPAGKTAYAIAASAYLKQGNEATGKMEIAWVRVFAK